MAIDCDTMAYEATLKQYLNIRYNQLDFPAHLSKPSLDIENSHYPI
jgi:hypothetical protein